MQIKLNNVIAYTFFFILLLPFSLLANNDLFEYRGIKLGMSIDEISKSESVRTGFMPNPKKLECLKGQYSYNISNEDIYLGKEIRKNSYKKEFIYITSNDLLICKHKDRLLAKVFPALNAFRLKGKTNLSSDNIEYRFYKKKLYRINVVYKSPPLENSLYNLLKRFKNDRNVEEFVTSNFRMYQDKLSNRERIDYNFKSKLDQNFEVRIISTYYINKNYTGLNIPYYSTPSSLTKKKLERIFFILWDKNKIDSVDKAGELLLLPKINALKFKKKNEKIISNQKKKQEDRLKKKYDY